MPYPQPLSVSLAVPLTVSTVNVQGLPPRMAEYGQLLRMHTDRMSECVHANRESSSIDVEWQRALAVLDAAAAAGLRPLPGTFSRAVEAMRTGPTVPQRQRKVVLQYLVRTRAMRLGW